MTITVNTLNDPPTPVSGQNSLREAIATANNDPGGGDTINFASGLRGTIGLTQGALPPINADMTITGPGSAVLTVDGLNASGIFIVTKQQNITISGLTLAHGKSDQGGAVFNSAKLTISGCIYDQWTSAGKLRASGTTTTQLESSAAVARRGEVVTFTTTVTTDGAPAPAGDGSVEFFDSTTGTELGTVPVKHGLAALRVTFDKPTAGNTIAATYIPTLGSLQPGSGRVKRAIVAAT